MDFATLTNISFVSVYDRPYIYIYIYVNMVQVRIVGHILLRFCSIDRTMACESNILRKLVKHKIHGYIQNRLFFFFISRLAASRATGSEDAILFLVINNVFHLCQSGHLISLGRSLTSLGATSMCDLTLYSCNDSLPQNDAVFFSMQIFVNVLS